MHSPSKPIRIILDTNLATRAAGPTGVIFTWPAHLGELPIAGPCQVCIEEVSVALNADPAGDVILVGALRGGSVSNTVELGSGSAGGIQLFSTLLKRGSNAFQDTRPVTRDSIGLELSAGFFSGPLSIEVVSANLGGWNEYAQLSTLTITLVVLPQA